MWLGVFIWCAVLCASRFYSTASTDRAGLQGYRCLTAFIWATWSRLGTLHLVSLPNKTPEVLALIEIIYDTGHWELFFFFFFFLIKRYISESAWSVVPHKVFSIFTRCAFNRSPSYFSFKNHGKVSRGTLEKIKKKHFDRKTRRQVFVVLVRLRGLMGVQLHGGVCLQRMCGMWMA